MRRIVLFTLISTFLLAATAFAAENVPLRLSDIKLGNNVSMYSDVMKKGTERPVPGKPWLSTISFEPMEEYKSGYVTVGNTVHKGRICRIKVKYAKNDMKSYIKLAHALSRIYGEGQQWGEPGSETLEGLKWRLSAGDMGTVNVILERYVSDDLVTPNTSVRLYFPKCFEEEKAGYKK